MPESSLPTSVPMVKTENPRGSKQSHRLFKDDVPGLDKASIYQFQYE
jgi:hypothetical protein